MALRVILVLLVWSFAASAFDCLIVFPQLTLTKAFSLRESVRAVVNSYSGSEVYTPADRLKITDIWNSDRPESEKTKKTFEVYTEARLRSLPESAAAFARKVLALSELEKTRGGKRWERTMLESLEMGSPGGYSSQQGVIFVVGHGDSDRTPSLLDFMILAHELEHAIQDGLRVHYKLSPEEMGEGEKYVHNKFLAEKSAMMAETAFLLGIPDCKSKLATLLELRAKQDGQSSEDFRKSLSQSNLIAYQLALAHLDSNLNPIEYVKSQWRNGRYSLPAIRDANLKLVLSQVESNLNWVMIEASNRTHPDWPYLGLWNRVLLKTKQVINQLRGRQASPIVATGTLRELRESLSELAITYVKQEAELAHLQNNLTATSSQTAAPLESIKKRRVLLQKIVREIELHLFYSDQTNDNLPPPKGGALSKGFENP
ncbi:hypothetical protein K2X33_14775 [bacterium]|nr:hypothetical protein [bacterium]